VVVPSRILYGIPRRDDGKLFGLEVWHSTHNYIHRRRAGIYYSYRRTANCRKTASYRRTASQTDETAVENQAVLDSKGSQVVPEQKDRKRRDSQTLRIAKKVATRSKRVSRKATSKDAKRTSKLIGLQPFPIFLLPAHGHSRSFVKNAEITGS
jgi:hypothetical protein